MTMGKAMTYVRTAADTMTAVDAEGNTKDYDLADIEACQAEWATWNQMLIDEGDELTPPMPAESLQNDIDLFDALGIEDVPEAPVAHNTQRVAYYGVMATCRNYLMQRVPA